MTVVGAGPELALEPGVPLMSAAPARLANGDVVSAGTKEGTTDQCCGIRTPDVEQERRRSGAECTFAVVQQGGHDAGF